MFSGMYCNCNWTCLCTSHLCIQTITLIVVTGTVARRRRTYTFDVNDNKNLQHDNIESWGWTWMYNKFRRHSEQLLWWGIYTCVLKVMHIVYTSWSGAIAGSLMSSSTAILCNSFPTCLTHNFTTPYESAVTRVYFLSLHHVKLSCAAEILTRRIVLP